MHGLVTDSRFGTNYLTDRLLRRCFQPETTGN